MSRNLTASAAWGGDVIISFGGMDGKELALVHTSVTSLQAAYQQAITKYRLTWMDMDIEWGAIFDTAATTRRSKALKNLQTENPGLMVSFTLGSLNPDSGITKESLKLLANAKAHGVRVDFVNVMVMNYDPVRFCDDMGVYALACTRKTWAQCQSINLATRIGMTPQCGVNSYKCEIFTLANAQTVYDFAQANSYVGMLAYWSINNDASREYLDIFKPFNTATGVIHRTRAGAPALRQHTVTCDIAGRAITLLRGHLSGAPKTVIVNGRKRIITDQAAGASSVKQ